MHFYVLGPRVLPNRLRPVARLLAAALAGALALSACGGRADPSPAVGDEALAPPPGKLAAVSEPRAITGADGVESVVADISRMVVLNGYVNEIVYALGGGEFVVGNDLSARYPPETQQVAKIGYQRTLNAEAIIALQPTLVLGSVEAGPAFALRQVRETGTPVVILPADFTLEGAYRRVELVGEALGAEEEAGKLAQRMRAEVAAAQASVPRRADPPRVAFLYARGRDLLLLFGRGSPSEALITAAGGIDAGASSGVGEFTLLTAEGLAAAAPDWLILTDDGLESMGGMEGLLAAPGVAQTEAGRRGNILVYDDLLFLGLTPRVGEALQNLVEALYGGDDGG